MSTQQQSVHTIVAAKHMQHVTGSPELFTTCTPQRSRRYVSPSASAPQQVDAAHSSVACEHLCQCLDYDTCE